MRARQKAYEQQARVKARNREYQRHWHQANKTRRLAQIADWERANPERVRATSAARRAAELNATPPWADKDATLAIYAEAHRLSLLTGVLNEVDHIIPLQHPDVCGLHIPLNLTPLPAGRNRSKSNFFDPAAEAADRYNWLVQRGLAKARV